MDTRLNSSQYIKTKSESARTKIVSELPNLNDKVMATRGHIQIENTKYHKCKQNQQVNCITLNSKLFEVCTKSAFYGGKRNVLLLKGCAFE